MKIYKVSEKARFLEMEHVIQSVYDEIDKEVEREKGSKEGVTPLTFFFICIGLGISVILYFACSIFFFNEMIFILELWFLKPVIITLPGAIPGLHEYIKEKRRKEYKLKQLIEKYR